MRFRLYSPGFNFPNFKIFRPGGSQLSAGHFPLLPGRCSSSMVLMPWGGTTSSPVTRAWPRYSPVDPRPGEVTLGAVGSCTST